jgi:uncharacterized oligopeptide transporter (OPT) family protein
MSGAVIGIVLGWLNMNYWAGILLFGSLIIASTALILGAVFHVYVTDIPIPFSGQTESSEEN